MSNKDRAKALVSQMTLAEKVSQLQYDAPAIEHLGLKAYNWWNECLHGVGRAGTATVFPQAIGMAASFNKELMYEVATAISDEARAKYNEYKSLGQTEIYQGLTFWSPNINIFRDPRWGRGHETYGEDPHLTSEMGIAFIKGLQGDDAKHRKLDATIKHFYVHSGPEHGRHGFDSIVSQEDIDHTYIVAFKNCIEQAKPAAVMGAYNAVNGELCCGSSYLIQEVLRDQLGFEGYYVSDCGAICDFHEFHKFTSNQAESAALAVKSGCDLNCGNAYRYLKTAVASGLISEEEITICCERLMEARYDLGMMDEDCVYDSITMDVVECEKHTNINREMARESIVLLKNNNILPLSKEWKSIAVIGPNADDKVVLLGNYNGTPSRYTTLLRGIQEAADEVGIKVNYATGCHLVKPTEAFVDQIVNPYAEAVLAAKRSDVVIMCMGLNPLIEGEEGDAYNADLSGDKPDIELPKVQREMYEAVKATGTPIVFVNVSGSCINLKDQDTNCEAVVQCFYPGAEGGSALADILFGKVSPSARLPITFYENLDNFPAISDYSMKNRTYRFYEGSPVYSFAHGLSYTNITEDWTNDNTVILNNTGNYDTKYVVLQYKDSSKRELISFKNVFLKSKECTKVQF